MKNVKRTRNRRPSPDTDVKTVVASMASRQKRRRTSPARAHLIARVSDRIRGLFPRGIAGLTVNELIVIAASNPEAYLAAQAEAERMADAALSAVRAKHKAGSPATVLEARR